MDKFLKIALMLTAIDAMSAVSAKATNNVISDMARIQQAAKNYANGRLMMDAGKQVVESLQPAIDAFGDMETAGAKLQNSMMKEGGVLDAKVYQKMYNQSQKLSDGYANSTEDYLRMMAVMRSNRMTEAEILSGPAQTSAKLAAVFDNMNPASIGEFLTHARNDAGVAVADMDKVADTIQRLHFMGLGKTGEEAVGAMSEYFGKISLGISNLKTQGIRSFTELGVLGNIFITKNLNPQMVGTNIDRLMRGMRDGKRMDKVNEEARKYGKALQFFDSNHKFLGISNMVAQLDKLKGLDPRAISAILDPFSGKQGYSKDFVEFLANEGVHDFNERMIQYKEQADLNQRFANLIKTQQYQEATFKSSWRNTEAEIGSNLSPTMTKLYATMNNAAKGIRNFAHEHPGVVKVTAGIISAAGALLFLAGTFNVIVVAARFTNTMLGLSKILGVLPGAFRLVGFILSTLGTVIWSAVTATWAWTAALLSNPMTWIVIAIIAAIAAIGLITYAIYKNWDAIKQHLGQAWENIKGIFKRAITWLWNYVIAIFNPAVLIYQHWDKIGPWFHKLWEGVKRIFFSVLKWVIELHVKMFDAGKKMVMMIADGIKSGAHHAIEAMTNVVKKVRNLLPFSPAKDGPLRDIHKIRLIETIAESITPFSLIEKMKGVASAVFELRPQHGNYQPLSASPLQSGITLVFSPTYNAAPGETSGSAKEAFLKMMKDCSRQMADMVARELSNTRKSYN